MGQLSRHSQRRTASGAAWLAGVCLFALCASWSPRAEAIEVRVRAKSALDATVTAAGTLVHVSGSLRDDLDRGLPQRKVRIFFVDQTDGATPTPDLSEVVYTDRRGAFGVSRELDPGQWKVAVRFDETEHVTASTVSKSIVVRPAPVDLRIQVPPRVVGKVDAVPVRIRATVAGVGLAEAARVEVNGENAAQVRLDQFGRASVDIASNLTPGINDVSVVIPSGRHRKRAEKGADVRVSDRLAPEARLEEVVERFERGLRVEGKVEDQLGPVRDMRVAVRISRRGARADDSARDGQSAPSAAADGLDGRDGRHGRKDKDAPYERFVTTDMRGRFSAFFAGDDLEDGIWEATVTVVPDVGREVSVSTEPVELDRATSRWILDALGVLALLGGVGLVLQRFWQVIRAYVDRRRRKRDARERAEAAVRDTEQIAPERLPEELAPVDEAPSRTRLSGLVWDVWKSRPVPGAELIVRSADGAEVLVRRAGSADTQRPGAFRIDELEAGAYALEVRADGFVPGHLEFRVPHRGRLSNTRLNLVAVPLKIRRLYQSLVERLEGEKLWGRLSPRQIEETLVEAQGASAPQADTAARRAFVDTLRRRLAEGDAEMSGDELVAMMTAVVEETYFSARTFDISVFHLARDIAERLRRRAEEAAE